MTEPYNDPKTESTESVINPYAAPPSLLETSNRSSAGQRPYVRSSLAATARRWFFVCALSALPSFLLGFMITGARIWAMLAGILVFACFYTLIDYQTAGMSWRQQPRIRRTLRFTYGTRIVMSVILPVGYVIDMWCGIASVTLSQSLMPEEVVALDSGESTSFVFAFVTTLIQGCVMNVVLAVYGSLVLATLWFTGMMRGSWAPTPPIGNAVDRFYENT